MGIAAFITKIAFLLGSVQPCITMAVNKGIWTASTTGNASFSLQIDLRYTAVDGSQVTATTQVAIAATTFVADLGEDLVEIETDVELAIAPAPNSGMVGTVTILHPTPHGYVKVAEGDTLLIPIE